MHRWLVLALLLTACGAPSQEQIQATVAAAVQQTAQAQPPPTPTPDPCSPAAITVYGNAVKPLTDTYFAQLGIAQSTPRVSLGVALQGLFTAEQAVNALPAPPCLVDWSARAKNMMELYRISLNQFAAQNESDSAVNMNLAAALRVVVEGSIPTIITGKVPVLPK